MATGASSRKEPPAKTTPSKQKKNANKLTDSVASSARSSPATTAPPSMNGEANGSATKASKGKKAAATADSSQQGDIETQQCKHCKKYVPKEGFSNHSKQCLRDKKEKKRQKEAQAAAAQAAIDNANAAKEKDAEGDLAMGDTIAVDIPGVTLENGEPVVETTPASASGPKNAKKSAVVLGDTSSNAKKSKKRKADDTPTAAATESASKPPPKKQKKKDDNKPKVAKPKGPVDVEKQCGVILPNGAMCARSLTCKSHSMGAKRSVPGRSLPYDTLLHQYQKKNQAKQQKAALASTAPLADDSQLQTGPIDSDEEREAVMAGIARAAPLPLYEKPMISARQRYNFVRMKDMLSNALGGNRGSGLFASAPRRSSVGPSSAADDAAVPGSAVVPGSATSAVNGASEWEGTRRMSAIPAT